MEDVFRIVRHDPRILERERNRLTQVVRQAIPLGRVLEVGSTAVPGLIGKEDIDIAVLVADHEFPKARACLDRVFSRDDQQLSTDQYQGYVLASPLDAALQLTVEGSQHDTFEKFMLRLQASAELRKTYNKLKKTWHNCSMTDYRSAKRQFIESALTEHYNERSALTTEERSDKWHKIK